MSFPRLTSNETGYGIAWCSCRYCRCDYRIGQLERTVYGDFVCDSPKCLHEYLEEQLRDATKDGAA